jgi:hypothetical protein
MAEALRIAPLLTPTAPTLPLLPPLGFPVVSWALTRPFPFFAFAIFPTFRVECDRFGLVVCTLI